LTFIEDITSSIDNTINDIMDYSFLNNEIIINFKSELPEDMKSFIEVIDDNVITVLLSFHQSVPYAMAQFAALNIAVKPPATQAEPAVITAAQVQPAIKTVK